MFQNFHCWVDQDRISLVSFTVWPKLGHWASWATPVTENHPCDGKPDLWQKTRPGVASKISQGTKFERTKVKLKTRTRTIVTPLLLKWAQCKLSETALYGHGGVWKARWQFYPGQTECRRHTWSPWNSLGASIPPQSHLCSLNCF